MMEQFEKFNEALDRLEAILTEMKNDNEALRRENAELKGVIEDRDLEILQLQEDAGEGRRRREGREGRDRQHAR